MRPRPPRKVLRVPTLAVRQGSRRIYSFSVDGKKLSLFAAVSRISRDQDRQLEGYQRPEAVAHIRAIRRYLESSDALLPNALVVAFDGRVRFESVARTGTRGATFGHLIIPLDPDLSDADKPGWVVDGQQRSAAIREANVNGFPVFVTAFVTDSIAEQRSQFILVNSTKPLPKGLIHELLPVTRQEDLPIGLLKRRLPALLLERLNYDEDSPLKGMIRTPTTVSGVIKDNSILKAIAASIEDGALYDYFDPEAGGGDADSMLLLLKNYWTAVAKVFSEAWHQSPRRSRLVHGVGIVGMGCLMDEIAWVLGVNPMPSSDAFAKELRSISGLCHWMDGEWDFGDGVRRWDELQNTPNHILWLSDRLIRAYRAARLPSAEAA